MARRAAHPTSRQPAAPSRNRRSTYPAHRPRPIAVPGPRLRRLGPVRDVATHPAGARIQRTGRVPDLVLSRASIRQQEHIDPLPGVEVAAATAEDLAGDTDAAYGCRVFLRHCCFHLPGPDPSAALPAFLRTPTLLAVSTATSASISGDGGRAGVRDGGRGPAGCPVARKALLAVAGLVSVHDDTRTTGRSRAVRRSGELDPSPPPSWASCTPGPAESATPHARKPSAHWPTVESSLRSSNASTA